MPPPSTSAPRSASCGARSATSWCCATGKGCRKSTSRRTSAPMWRQSAVDWSKRGAAFEKRWAETPSDQPPDEVGGGGAVVVVACVVVVLGCVVGGGGGGGGG